MPAEVMAIVMAAVVVAIMVAVAWKAVEQIKIWINNHHIVYEVRLLVCGGSRISLPKTMNRYEPKNR